MSFISTIIQNLQRLQTHPILNEVRAREIVTYSADQLLHMIYGVRAYLRLQHNIKPGDRVALLASNSARWIAIDLAIIAEGAITVPLYTRSTAAELCTIVADCQPKLLILADKNLQSLFAAQTITIAHYEEIFTVATLSPDTLAPTVEAHLPATIIYTSGTSGEPKGVMLAHNNILSMCQQTGEQLAAMAMPGARIYHYLPLCFAGSRMMLWTQLYLGQLTYLGTDVQNFLEEMHTSRPHFFLNVPAVLERIKQGIETELSKKNRLIRFIYYRGTFIYGHKQPTDRNLWDKILLKSASFLCKKIKTQIGSQLKFLICGSAPLHTSTQDWYKMLGIPIYQVYGLTETTAIISIDRPLKTVSGYVGMPLPICEVKISDTGELLCRGANIFSGYWNNVDATNQVLKNGWFHTGDQAERDAEGRLKIIGRCKELLVLTSGHKVIPMRLEEQLLNFCKGAQHVLVIGHDRPYLSALITGNLSEQALEHSIQHLNAELAHYQKIRRVHKLETAFTIENGFLTANGKLKRKQIEHAHLNIIEAMYA